MIVDAGGGTIDISTYQKPVGVKKFEEISAPKCEPFPSQLFFSMILLNLILSFRRPLLRIYIRQHPRTSILARPP